MPRFVSEKTDKIGNGTYAESRTCNYSQVMMGLTDCSEAGMTDSRETIKAIRPGGATCADNGLELAKDILNSGREDAKKVVIFFTDGSRTAQSGFDSDIASSMVSTAKAMKDAGANVYTVGAFSGANPSDDLLGASDENKFMHAVSSNYPNASYSSSLNGWNWVLGTRAESSDYYNSATNAAELKKVSEDISSEIVTVRPIDSSVTDQVKVAK